MAVAPTLHDVALIIHDLRTTFNIFVHYLLHLLLFDASVYEPVLEYEIEKNDSSGFEHSCVPFPQTDPAGAVLVWGCDHCGSIDCGACTMHLTCTKVTASGHARRQRDTVLAEQPGDQVWLGALVAHVEVCGGAQQLADALYCLSIACAIGTGLSDNT